MNNTVNFGYTCATCGAYVSYGEAHFHYTQPYFPPSVTANYPMFTMVPTSEWTEIKELLKKILEKLDEPANP